MSVAALMQGGIIHIGDLLAGSRVHFEQCYGVRRREVGISPQCVHK